VGEHAAQRLELHVTANEGGTDDIVLEMHGERRCARSGRESMASDQPPGSL
jgi:hypothetical protein